MARPVAISATEIALIAVMDVTTSSDSAGVRTRG
jgi:hypothetical protein